MEKYLGTNKLLEETKKPDRRRVWKRSLIELNGRFDPKYRHEMSSLLIQSYTQVGAFPHDYGSEGFPCSTFRGRLAVPVDRDDQRCNVLKQGVSALQFDSKGIYLVSVTKSGCLTVHDFEALYCQATNSSSTLEDDEGKYVLHISTDSQLDAVCWNPTNQDEVACTSTKTNELYIYDIGYVSSEPVEVLRTRPAVTIHGTHVHNGLTDIAFSVTDKSRLFASDTNGVVNVWDRRTNAVPCLQLRSNSRGALNTIKLNLESQVVFGAGRLGVIYMWDLRGGKGPEGFQNHKGVSHSPVSSWKLSSVLEKIGSLKAQSDIVSKEVHSIDFDPSCPHQLAFHLDDGWSGVLDTYNSKVTHVHCPPPAWLANSESSTDLLHLRKPSWLPTCSIYAVGSTSNYGIHLLDFYPDITSPCHVDYREDVEQQSQVKIPNKQNKFVPLSEKVTACAAHPFNGTIVAGTKLTSEECSISAIVSAIGYAAEVLRGRATSGRWNNVGKGSRQNRSETSGKRLALRAGSGGSGPESVGCRQIDRAAPAGRRVPVRRRT